LPRDPSQNAGWVACPVRVLVVDDYQPFREAIAAMLRTLDEITVVALAESGEESIAAVTREEVDLVLMDINLPGISGLEACREIAARRDAPAVVLMSTYPSDAFDPAEWGAMGYVDKSDLTPERLDAIRRDVGG
jgi:two-component system, NarL family, invasion response regulator UvrY